MKFSPLLLFVFFSLSVYGQFSLSDTVLKDIDKLKTSIKDTIICFTIPSSVHMRYDSLPGIGDVATFETQYLIYKKGNKTLSQKYVHYCNELCDSNLFTKSLPIEVDCDSIFLTLRKSLRQISKEEIYPYIYKTLPIDTYDTSYNILEVSHPWRYSIEIYTLKDRVFKIIDTYGLIDNLGANMSNINFKNNIHTRLNLLYNQVKRQIEKVDKAYKFRI